MSYLKINITYDENLITPTMHKRIMNRLYREELEYHKQSILPRHFQNVPETEPLGPYGYAPRSRRWMARKKREGAHLEPNVYSGQMRFLVLWNSIVRATSNRGSLTVKNYFPLTEQRRKELEAFSQREIERMAARMERKYVQYANSPEYARKRAPKKLTP